MNGGDAGVSPATGTKPADILGQLIGIFASRRRLNQPLRIRHRNRRYHISCRETDFLAYRINDHCGLSPGVPGWPVCIITREAIMHDSTMSAFTSTEPSAHDWLRCMADEDFELIAEGW